MNRIGINLVDDHLIDSARRYARLGLDIASTSVSYAGDLLKDVARHLRETGKRFDAGPGGSQTATPNAAGGGEGGPQA